MELTTKECLELALKLKEQLKDHCKQKRGRSKQLCDALQFKSPSYIYKWFDVPNVPRGETLLAMFAYAGFELKVILEIYSIMLKAKEERDRKEEEKRKGRKKGM